MFVFTFAVWALHWTKEGVKIEEKNRRNTCGPLCPLYEIPKGFVVPSFCLLCAFAKYVQIVKQKVMQGVSECFSVPLLLIWVVLKFYCESCAKLLQTHMKNHNHILERLGRKFLGTGEPD